MNANVPCHEQGYLIHRAADARGVAAAELSCSARHLLMPLARCGSRKNPDVSRLTCPVRVMIRYPVAAPALQFFQAASTTSGRSSLYSRPRHGAPNRKAIPASARQEFSLAIGRSARSVSRLRLSKSYNKLISVQSAQGCKIVRADLRAASQRLTPFPTNRNTALEMSLPPLTKTKNPSHPAYALPTFRSTTHANQ